MIAEPPICVAELEQRGKVRFGATGGRRRPRAEEQGRQSMAVRSRDGFTLPAVYRCPPIPIPGRNGVRRAGIRAALSIYLGDGSVRPTSNEVSVSIYQALVTRAGVESVINEY